MLVAKPRDQAVPDLKFLDDPQNTKRKPTLNRVPALRSTTKTKNLDEVVKIETKRRYGAFAEATQLYYKVLQAKGQVFTVVFTKPGDLGFTLALSRDGANGRTMITVDSVARHCENRDVIRVSDELIMIYDCLVVQPSREDFMNLVERISKARRPIKFLFTPGAHRNHVSQTAEELAAKEREEAAFVAELEQLKRNVRNSVLEQAERAAGDRARIRAAGQAAALERARDAAQKYFEAEKLANEAICGQSIKRADEWRNQAAVLAAKEGQPRSTCYGEINVISGGPQGQDVVAGDVVRVLDCPSGSMRPSAHARHVGRVGIVVRMHHHANAQVVATVKFSDAPLNYSYSTHPAIVASDGLFQCWRGNVNLLDAIIDPATVEQHKGPESSADAEIGIDQKQSEPGDQTENLSSANAVVAMPPEEESGSVAAEMFSPEPRQERARYIENHDCSQDVPTSDTGSVSAVASDDRRREGRTEAQHSAIANMEAERRRRSWNPFQPQCGSFVYHHQQGEIDQRPGTESFGSYVLRMIPFSRQSIRNPNQSSQVIKQELLQQKTRLRTRSELDELLHNLK